MHDYKACGAGGSGGEAAADPFTPRLMVLRQVAPTPKPIQAGVGAETGSESEAEG